MKRLWTIIGSATYLAASAGTKRSSASRPACQRIPTSDSSSIPTARCCSVSTNGASRIIRRSRAPTPRHRATGSSCSSASTTSTPRSCGRAPPARRSRRSRTSTPTRARWSSRSVIRRLLRHDQHRLSDRHDEATHRVPRSSARDTTARAAGTRPIPPHRTFQAVRAQQGCATPPRVREIVWLVGSAAAWRQLSIWRQPIRHGGARCHTCCLSGQKTGCGRPVTVARTSRRHAARWPPARA